MTVTVSVYEKAGLCRGPFIPTARFWREGWLGYLPATGPGPLPGPDPVYTVSHPPGIFSWQLRVDSPRHQSWGFWVMDGERYEMWLDRRPGF